MNRSDWPAHLLIMNNWEPNRWLSRFVLEIRSTKHPVSDRLWYFALHPGVKPQLDIFGDAAFASFWQNLDAEMKHLKAGGLGVHTKQAEPITPDEEELLWSKNLLGAHSPQTLVDTLVYLCGTCLLSTSLDAAMSL